MTSQVLGVLTLALVCSIFGTALEQTADTASKHTMPTHHPRQHVGIHTTTAPWTTSLSRNNYNLTKKTIPGEIYTSDDVIETNEHKLYYAENFKLKNNVNHNELDETAVKIIDKDVRIVKNKYLTFGNGEMRPFDANKVDTRMPRHVSFHSHTRNLKRVKREDDSDRCDLFYWKPTKDKIVHPHNSTSSKPSNTYYRNINCVTVIRAKDGQSIKLTFIDVFEIEDHPNCQYDYLEIRDGKDGYANLKGKVCGSIFPGQMVSTGPYMWLKFYSDETIEYDGFTIKIDIYHDATSYKIPEPCYIPLSGSSSSSIDVKDIPDECISQSQGHDIDVLWNITTAEDTNIYLNFTEYILHSPNECEQNLVQVFGHILEDSAKLAHYCGSVANPVSTHITDGKAVQLKRGNTMFIRLFAKQTVFKEIKLQATYTAFRVVKPSNNESCEDYGDFNCGDNTCIDYNLRCTPDYAHCRLKTDQDPDLCSKEQKGISDKPHILVILIIFCLILSGMSFVFLFKCVRKLYQDHKIIKEHISQSCEDRLDTIMGDSRLSLDPKRLQRTSEPRAVSLERENHTNELFKQQRSISQHKQTSIDSDFAETHLDLDDAPWKIDVETIPESQDVKVEPHRNGRPRRSDTSRKEESIRSRKESLEEKEKKEIRDAAVGVPDTKESGCQTRESLFQVDPAPSSDGSNSNGNSRGFSTFGYSGATLVRKSPPPAISSIQIELLRQLPAQETSKSQKKLPDRRPMSSETTRSAPDVIIVSKPIR